MTYKFKVKSGVHSENGTTYEAGTKNDVFETTTNYLDPARGVDPQSGQPIDGQKYELVSNNAE